MPQKEDQDFRPFLKRVRDCLLFATANRINHEIQSKVKLMVKPLLVQYGQVFRRMALEPNIFLLMRKREDISTMCHVPTEHSNISTTRQFISDQFWWPFLSLDVTSFVKSYIGCQRYKPLWRYFTTLLMQLYVLFETLSIDFSGLLPVGLKKERYLLIAVPHLTE